MTAKKIKKDKPVYKINDEGYRKFFDENKEYIDAWCDGYEEREHEDDLVIGRLEKENRLLRIASNLYSENLMNKITELRIKNRLFNIFCFISGFIAGTITLYLLVK